LGETNDVGNKRRRFVAKAEAGRGWRIWDNTQKKWWGQHYRRCPEELLLELNAKKRPEVIVKLVRELQMEAKTM
jgi:hypothetical protein